MMDVIINYIVSCIMLCHQINIHSKPLRLFLQLRIKLDYLVCPTRPGILTLNHSWMIVSSLPPRSLPGCMKVSTWEFFFVILYIITTPSTLTDICPFSIPDTNLSEYPPLVFCICDLTFSDTHNWFICPSIKFTLNNKLICLLATVVSTQFHHQIWI